MPKHLALDLRGILCDEGPMDANRRAAERISHQGHDGADAFMPAERMAQVIEESNVEAATFREIPPAERDRVPPSRAQRFGFFPDTQASLDARGGAGPA